MASKVCALLSTKASHAAMEAKSNTKAGEVYWKTKVEVHPCSVACDDSLLRLSTAREAGKPPTLIQNMQGGRNPSPAKGEDGVALQ